MWLRQSGKCGGVIVKLRSSAGFLAILALLASCSDKEVLLTGERLPIADQGDVVSRAEPFATPSATANSSWTHTNGTASHQLSNPNLSAAPSLAWSADIGAGDSRKHRIAAAPVVSGGRVFTMDALSGVSAVSTAGQVLWTTNLTPEFADEKEASGGGLAVDGDVLFATTGFGTLNAINVESGSVLWSHRVDGAVSGAPTVYGDLVYIISRDGTAWAIHKDNGRIAWSLPGVASQAGFTGGSAPAVTDQIAIFPFGAGELVASFPRGGVRIWSASLTGRRIGQAYTLFGDVTGAPVIDGNVVYSGTSAGRIAAMNLQSGEHLWTAREGAMSPVWPSGGSIFSITDDSRLVRLDAETGETIWAVELPYYKKARLKKRDKIYPHFGPVLAGGLLRVASGDGLLRSFDPQTGGLVYEAELPGGAAANMAVADGTLYIVSTKGKLHAFR